MFSVPVSELVAAAAQNLGVCTVSQENSINHHSVRARLEGVLLMHSHCGFLNIIKNIPSI